jgi:hypothetical protein
MTMPFFEAQDFATDEVPDCPIVHIEAAFGKLRHKSS